MSVNKMKQEDTKKVLVTPKPESFGIPDILPEQRIITEPKELELNPAEILRAMNYGVVEIKDSDGKTSALNNHNFDDVVEEKESEGENPDDESKNQ